MIDLWRILRFHEPQTYPCCQKLLDGSVMHQKVIERVFAELPKSSFVCEPRSLSIKGSIVHWVQLCLMLIIHFTSCTTVEHKVVLSISGNNFCSAFLSSAALLRALLWRDHTVTFRAFLGFESCSCLLKRWATLVRRKAALLDMFRSSRSAKCICPTFLHPRSAMWAWGPEVWTDSHCVE